MARDQLIAFKANLARSLKGRRGLQSLPPPRRVALQTFRRPYSTAAEAAARRAERDRNADGAKESGGRGGLDPTRYGDWEKDGLISDF
jgi:hypothetical protein